MKKIFSLFLLSIGLYGCSNFLEEELVSTLTQEYYATPDGVEALVNGAYEGLRFHHNYEWAYAMTNFGTDEFTNGGGADFVIWNTYVATLDPNNTTILSPFWNAMFAQINLSNTGIVNIPIALPEGEKRNTRLGEVYFIRDFSYYQLVTQFGGVPIRLKPTVGLETEFHRKTTEEVFKRTIADLRTSLELLPANPAQNGRITKAAAQHFLAKAYLTRASELYASFSKETDLDSAAYFADQVILNSTRKLATDYKDIFNYTAVNGPNEQNAEIILASQFDNTQALLGRYGNQTHMYFLSVYQTQPGMTRDIVNGREFQRLRPTDYALDIYDRKNDSRFYKSFKTSYIANNAATLPKWTSANAPSPELAGQFKFAVGDTSLIYIVNAIDDNRFDQSYIDHAKATTMIRYYDKNGTTTSSYSASTYPSLSKYIDPFRVSPADAKGTRDGILARIGETYLIAAEAYGRLGNYSQALTYINALRTRAAYKGGEARANVYYLAENIPYGTTGSTVANMEATEAMFTPGDPATASEMYPTSATESKEKMFIHFILNERSRELLGEFHRWVDLARTKTLVERASEFNAEARPNIREKHLIRPIPQAYLDVNLRDGRPLTAEEKQSEQNPGW